MRSTSGKRVELIWPRSWVDAKEFWGGLNLFPLCHRERLALLTKLDSWPQQAPQMGKTGLAAAALMRFQVHQP